MMVMYGGTVVESGSTEAIFHHRAHPYTQGLFGARPRLGAARGARLATISGTVPELADLPRGCPFSDRCSFAAGPCMGELPPAVALGGDHVAHCFHLPEVACGQGATT
jgi:peptide/nickel transport system ATP-binding protein